MKQGRKESKHLSESFVREAMFSRLSGLESFEKNFPSLTHLMASVVAASCQGNGQLLHENDVFHQFE